MKSVPLLLAIVLAVSNITVGAEIITSLEFRKDGGRQRVGTEIRYRLREGAPFTFGRALGLGAERIDHGTQLYIDGVAVFTRVLNPDYQRNSALLQTYTNKSSFFRSPSTASAKSRWIRLS